MVGELEIDARTRTATLAGRPLELSRKEFDLLVALAARAGEVVTKRELLAEVWQQPYGGGDRTVDVHLSWLRRKLGETRGRSPATCTRSAGSASGSSTRRTTAQADAPPDRRGWSRPPHQRSSSRS